MTGVEHKARFAKGDRIFSHYEMKWGTIIEIGNVEEVLRQGEPCPIKGMTDEFHTDAWHTVEWDDGGTSIMNDGGTMGWDMARIIPPHIAKRYGYGDDPNPPQPEQYVLVALKQLSSTNVLKTKIFGPYKNEEQVRNASTDFVLTHDDSVDWTLSVAKLEEL